MPQIGNDRFSDCDKLCNPDNGYSVSCQRICPGYKLPTTLLHTIPTTPIPAEDDGYTETPLYITIPVTIGCVLLVFGIIAAVTYSRRKDWLKGPTRRPVQEQTREHHENHEEGQIRTRPLHPRPELSGSRGNLENETDALLHGSQINDGNSNENLTLAPRDITDHVGTPHDITDNMGTTRDLINQVRNNYNTPQSGRNKTTDVNTSIKSVTEPHRNDQGRSEYIDIQTIRKKMDPEYVNLDDMRTRDGQDSGIPSESSSSHSLTIADPGSEMSRVDATSYADGGNGDKFTFKIEMNIR